VIHYYKLGIGHLGAHTHTKMSNTSQPPSEPKRAHRSTKTAGKLKVLPEQPDEGDRKPGWNSAGPSNETEVESGGTATAGESDDADVDDDDEPEVRMAGIYLFNDVLAESRKPSWPTCGGDFWLFFGRNKSDAKPKVNCSGPEAAPHLAARTSPWPETCTSWCLLLIGV
jgi:hypothetical protein